MRLSIRVVQKETGFSPHVIYENPREFKIFAGDTVCTTWKEAWTMGRIMRDSLREKKVV